MSKNIIESFLENRTDFIKLAQSDDAKVGVILTDKTKEVISLEKHFPQPFSIKEEIIFDDLRGFVEYVNAYKGDNTVCFAKRDSIVVIFDYHKKDSPQWGRHKATYKIQRSKRWEIWERAHNVWMVQKQFAEFLDTGLNEIIIPTQSDILSLVKNFRATVNYSVDSQEAPGGTQFTFKKTTKGGTALKEDILIPEFLTVALQPFDNLSVINPKLTESKQIPSYKLRAKISWKMDINGGSEEETLAFKIQILNFEMAVEETLETIRVAMSELTGVTTYIG